jgi:hypothetical protein
MKHSCTVVGMPVIQKKLVRHLLMGSPFPITIVLVLMLTIANVYASEGIDYKKTYSFVIRIWKISKCPDSLQDKFS